MLPLIIAPAGLALVVYITHRFFSGSQGSDIPQTIAALEFKDDAIRDQLLSLRIALGKIPLTLVGLLAGASTGREGPTVQVGQPSCIPLAAGFAFPATTWNEA